jgi:hypothetical protein
VPPHNQPGTFYGATAGPNNGGPPFFGAGYIPPPAATASSPPARFFSPQPPANSPPARYVSPVSPPQTLFTPPLYFSDQPPVAANAASPPLHCMPQPCSPSSPPLRYNFPPPPAVAAPPSRSPPPVLPTPEPPAAAGGAPFSYFFPQQVLHADSALSPVVGSPAPYPADSNARQPESVQCGVPQLPAVPAGQSSAGVAESSAPGT